ncbi:hypothetical protein Ancab_009896 [Ancistrocladus abbreviatus]
MGGIDMAEKSVKEISLKDLSRKLVEFAKARDWEKYHSPRNLLLVMRGEVDRGLPNWDESEKEHLGEELSNVLLYLLQLADICGIDLDENSEEEEGVDHEEDIIDSLPTIETDENSKEEEENKEYDEDAIVSVVSLLSGSHPPPLRRALSLRRRSLPRRKELVAGDHRKSEIPVYRARILVFIGPILSANRVT